MFGKCLSRGTPMTMMLEIPITVPGSIRVRLCTALWINKDRAS